VVQAAGRRQQIAAGGFLRPSTNFYLLQPLRCRANSSADRYTVSPTLIARADEVTE